MIKLQSLLDYTKPEQSGELSDDGVSCLAMLGMAELIRGPILYDRTKLRDIPEYIPVIEELEMHLGYKIFASRLPEDVQVSMNLVIFAAGFLIKTPGDAVMWAYTFTQAYRQKKAMIRLIDMPKLFPIGLPTQESKDAC